MSEKSSLPKPYQCTHLDNDLMVLDMWTTINLGEQSLKLEDVIGMAKSIIRGVDFC